jgi:hypothetical protein
MRDGTASSENVCLVETISARRSQFSQIVARAYGQRLRSARHWHTA